MRNTKGQKTQFLQQIKGKGKKKKKEKAGRGRLRRTCGLKLQYVELIQLDFNKNTVEKEEE